MPQDIKTITASFVLNISVNCYLVTSGDGFVLVDTATVGQRRMIERELEAAGCQPGNLRLVVLTHGDFDHCGSAAYLRHRFGTEVAMHAGDTGMVERGDMFWNRKQPGPLFRTLSGILFKLSAADRFKPDFYLTDGDNLSEYGFDASVIELPGHSRGSIGLLTAGGDLFCGDLLANRSRPALWSIMDDLPAAHTSVEKLKGLAINTVYPGHGQPFLMEQFTKSDDKRDWIAAK